MDRELGELAGLAATPLARRGLAMTALISGFTLATTRVDAQAITTDTAGIEAGDAKIPVSDGELPAYVAQPKGAGPFPVVLVNEEIFGVHAYIADICRRLAKLGYLAVAPEIYARSAGFAAMTDPGQIVREVVLKTPDAQVMGDLDATVSWTGDHKGDTARLAATGFCRGGRTTWLYAAHSAKLRAAVAWYGPLGGAATDIQPKTALDLAGDIRCPVLGLYGGQDGGIPVDQVRQAEARAKAAGKTVEIVIYPDAGHAFHADYRPSYQPADAQDGWRRMLAWFKTYGAA